MIRTVLIVDYTDGEATIMTVEDASEFVSVTQHSIECFGVVEGELVELKISVVFRPK